MTEKEVGVVTHFFDKISVAAINLTLDGLAVGDTVHIKGHTTDITSPVDSMRIDKDVVTQAKTGDAIGIKLATGKARPGDKVFKVIAA